MSLKDLLYPKFCLGCGLPGMYICPTCWRKIIPIGRATCLYCNKASLNGLTHPGCYKKLSTDGMVSIFKYTPLMRKIIKSIKYRLAREVFEELTMNIRPEYLTNLLGMKRVFSGALIQPIPLTRHRLKSRGFNQAYLVGKFFSQVLGLEMADYLIRVKETKPQAGLGSKSERHRNIRGVFGLRPGVKVKNKKIILVDDVITTGATVMEACKILKIKGAGRVYALTISG